MTIADRLSAHEPAGAGQRRVALTRLLIFSVLAVGEALTTSYLFVPEIATPALHQLTFLVRQTVLLCAASLVTFAVICWPRRHVFAARWQDAARNSTVRSALLVNCGLFILVIAASVGFSRYIVTVHEPPWGYLAAYFAVLAATGASLAWIAAPIGFWRSLLAHHTGEIVAAVAVGLLVMVAAGLAQMSWHGFAGVTLQASYRLLSLYETAVRVDYPSRVLGVGDFNVTIDDSCSGYEGLGLVSVYLMLFLWVFRGTLRFPNALALLPIALGTIWVLNVCRIAALVSLGAHVSPHVAVNGFHSQAGWIAFLLVAIGIMATAPRLAWFSRTASGSLGTWSASDKAMLALLAPFMALLVASIITAASAPYDAWLYPLKVVAIGAVLWHWRDAYGSLMQRVDRVSVAAGIVVGVLWIATAAPQGAAANTGLSAWIAAQPLGLLILWLAFRVLGAIVMVPIAEELAFRGLLHRWLISRRFETVTFSQFTWVAFIGSSVLFGLMHQRRADAALAGAVFALVMVRSGHLSSAIAAHMAANAVIIAWAIATRSWWLL